MSALQIAVGQLARHALNELYAADQEDGCCTRCCAPCGALDQLLRLGVLDRYVAPVADGEAWWSSDVGVDREFLGRAWRMRICHESGGGGA